MSLAKHAITFFTCCLSSLSILSADPLLPPTNEAPKKEKKPSPWFTGPLLTPAGHVVPYGHYNIEPYEFVSTNYGLYNSEWNTHSTPKFYQVSTQTICQIGLPGPFDIAFTPAWTWNHIEGASHWVLNDMSFGFDYQIASYKKGHWWPSLKLNVGATLPIGKYQKLHPKAKGTDIGGFGTWAPTIGLVTSDLFWWGGHIFFSPRFNVQYTIPTPVHVKNNNAYGGGHHTRGKVYPGQSLRLLFGFEISLSQRWVIAGDVQYQHINKTRFRGHKGHTHDRLNRVGAPSSEQFSLAPAIEYNWSNNYGIIAGAWFTIAGRNQTEFVSAVVAFNIYH